MKLLTALLVMFYIPPALGQYLPLRGETMARPLLPLGNLTSAPARSSRVFQAVAKRYRNQISISVADYGAKCNGTTDDTAALNSALNVNAGTYTVTLPQGTCRITSPIVVITSNTNFPSLVGTGPNTSVIEGDYTNWPTGSEAMIEINSADKVKAVYGVHNRRFGGFTMTSAGTIGANTPTGLDIKTTAKGVTSTNVDDYMPLFNASIDNILFVNLYRAISMTEGFNVNMNSLRGVGDANGISIAGESININVDACTFGDTAGTGIGIYIGSKAYASKALAPQTIHIENGTAFVSYRTNAYIGAGLYVTLDHSVFDGATANSIIVENPNNTWITDNYIYEDNANSTAIMVESPLEHTDGLWIMDNVILGGSTSNTVGIKFVAGRVRRGVHILGNRLTGFNEPILLTAVPAYSEIKGNYGQGNTSSLITIANSGSSIGDGLSIEGNSSSDSQPIIKTSGVLASSYFQNNNYSANGFAPTVSLQQMGYFTTTGNASDTYTPASVGALPNLANIPAGAHCYAQAADATAAGMTGVFIAPLKTAGTIVLSHSPTTSAHFSIACASY